MDAELEKELKKLRADTSALLSLLPAAYRLVARPVIERLLTILERMAADL